MSEINWEEATANSGFVNLEADKDTVLVLTNPKLEKKEKFNKIQVEFSADVIEEDGVQVVEKRFTTTSNRLKKKLRAIFENKKSDEKTKLSILIVGESYQTQYSVKEIPMEKVTPPVETAEVVQEQ